MRGVGSMTVATETAGPRSQAVPRAAASRGMTVVAFAACAFLFALTFLQKLAIGSGSSQINLALPALYLLVFVLAANGRLAVSLPRLALYLGFVGFAALSQMAVPYRISVPSFLVLPAMYLPFVFLVRLSDEEVRRASRFYQNLMVVAASIVLLQLAFQAATHRALSIEPYIPKALLMQGFSYDFQYRGGSFVRPNGLFFLETSFVSIFLAVGVVNEALRHHNWLRGGFLFVGLAACLGASGMVLLGLAAPLLIVRLNMRWLLLAIPILALAGLLVLASGVADEFVSRMGEFGQEGSSAYVRVTQPFLQLIDIFDSQQTLFDVSGAGNAPIGEADAWPITKLGYEYGLLPATLLLMLIAVAIWSRRDLPMTLSLLLVFNFTGGYAHNPVMAGLLFAFGPLFAGGSRGRRAEHGSAAEGNGNQRRH